MEEEKKEQVDFDILHRYLPVALVIGAIFVQMNLFVTPAQLEAKHREILNDVADKYATKEQSANLKSQLDDIQKKIDSIYSVILNDRGKNDNRNT